MKAPQAPDPVATAQAQSGMNRDTAITQQQLNMVDQYNPYGSVVYTKNGTDGFTDSQGKWIETPKYNQTTSYTPEGQKIFDSTMKAQGNLASLAADQSGFLKDYLGKGSPTLQTNLGLGTTLGLNDNLQLNGNLGLNSNIGGTYGTSLGGNYTSQIGGNYTDTYAGANDFSADRDMYTNSILQRLAPQQQKDESNLRNQLIQSGIRPGTAAWDSEYARLSSANNDARLGAILAGGQEQARMVNLARDAATFGNNANLQRAQFGNDAEMNRFNAQNAASLGQAAFANDATSRNAMFANEAAFNSNAANNAARAQNANFSNNALAQNASFNNSALLQMRNQPINELSALLGGSQLQNPAAASGASPQSQVAGVDYTGLVNNKYKSDLAAYQSGMGGLFGLGSALIGALPFSDRRLKENITRIGETAGGTPVYTYSYVWGGPTQVGVMADEVPEAAVFDYNSGFYRVDYSKVK